MKGVCPQELSSQVHQLQYGRLRHECEIKKKDSLVFGCPDGYHNTVH